MRDRTGRFGFALVMSCVVFALLYDGAAGDSSLGAALGATLAVLVMLVAGFAFLARRDNTKHG